MASTLRQVYPSNNNKLTHHCDMSPNTVINNLPHVVDDEVSVSRTIYCSSLVPSEQSSMLKESGSQDKSTSYRQEQLRCIKPGMLATEQYGYGASSEAPTVPTDQEATKNFSSKSKKSRAAASAGAAMLGLSTYTGNNNKSSSSGLSRSKTAAASVGATMLGRLPSRSALRKEGAPRRNSITAKGEIEVTLRKGSPSSQRLKRVTSLSFHDVAQVVTIEPAQTLGNKNELWFQQEEMKQIRKKAATLVLKTRGDSSGRLSDGRKYCVRGLEKMIDPESCLMKRNMAWDAVLQEQYLQEKEGVFGEDHMANLYKFSALRSQRDAVRRAEDDQKEVEQYLQSTRRMCRRLST